MAEKTNGTGATSKQIRAIYAIAREQGITREKLQKHIEKHYGVKSINELSKQQASELIDKLREIEAMNGDKDKNGESFKEIRKKMTELEERIMKMEVKIDALVNKLLEDVWLGQGARIAELEHKVNALRHAFKIYINSNEKKEHE